MTIMTIIPLFYIKDIFIIFIEEGDVFIVFYIFKKKFTPHGFGV
jgi:hypothetical protein